MEVRFVSVKTSVWYSVEHQQKLKVFFSSTFRKIVIPFLIIPFAYNGADSFPSNDMWLGLAVIGYAPPPYIFSNFLPHTAVTECSFSMNTVWDCILVFFNTPSCSYSLIHSSHLVMVLFGKQWAKMSLYISSAHWTLQSLYGRTPPVGFPYSTLICFFSPFLYESFYRWGPQLPLRECSALLPSLLSFCFALFWAGLRENWKGVKEFEFKFFHLPTRWPGRSLGAFLRLSLHSLSGMPLGAPVCKCAIEMINAVQIHMKSSLQHNLVLFRGHCPP